MMTNIDYEGFNDWSDEELNEALETIGKILESREEERISNALKNLEKAIRELQNLTEDIHYFNIGGEVCSLTDIFEIIKLHFREKTGMDIR